MQHNEAHYTVDSLLQAHSIAVEQALVLCRSAGPYWIHQQSCEALALTYKQALQKLTNLLTELSQHLNAEHLQRLVQPDLDMLLATIHRGKRFVETCRPSVAKSLLRHQSSSASAGNSHPRHGSFASSDGEDAFVLSEYTIANDKSWLLSALVNGHATDAIDVHLHDFLIAFSAVGAAVEDLNARYMARMTKGKMPQQSADQVPSPDLFWRKPHVLLVSGKHLDYVKDQEDILLDSQLERAINLRGHRNDMDTTQQQNTTITTAADDAAQLAAFVKEKIRWAKQTFQETIGPDFLDYYKLKKVGNITKTRSTVVDKVMWLGTKFALKLYDKDPKDPFLELAKIHVRLHHPNVVHAVALLEGNEEYGILMELMDESLKSFLTRHTFSLRLQEKVCIMLQIAKGMAHVHGRGLIHRDLKPSNVLVRSSIDTQSSRIQQLEVKVADFDQSKSISPDSSSFTTKKLGTGVYRAPEVLNENTESSNFTSSYKRYANVYSFAMTCFELLVEEEPFNNSARNSALWKRVIAGERPDLASISDDVCAPYLKHCLETWWADDPKTRHSFTHICCILRHLYVCLARCRSDTQPIVQFPFLAWPFQKWRRAQDIALERMEQFEIRRANEDWKDKGYLCESTRVNEIPYELHVMEWAIKKAADETEEDHSPNPQSTSNTGEYRHVQLVNRSSETPTGNKQVPTTAPPENRPHKSFGQKLTEFCCFSAHITPSNHEAFHDTVRRSR